MANLRGCFLHGSDHWSTPNDIYDYFINEGYIDPCPLYSVDDCLVKDFYDRALFINPPYSKLYDFSLWIEKQILNGCNIALLVPARTDTRWFHLLLPYVSSIEFIKGRLKFGGSKNSAPFPSIIMYLSKGVYNHGCY